MGSVLLRASLRLHFLHCALSQLSLWEPEQLKTQDCCRGKQEHIIYSHHHKAHLAQLNHPTVTYHINQAIPRRPSAFPATIKTLSRPQQRTPAAMTSLILRATGLIGSVSPPKNESTDRFTCKSPINMMPAWKEPLWMQ